MNIKKLKWIAFVLLILLFFAPAFSTIVLHPAATEEIRQYDGLQIIFMGVYNIPFILVSSVSLIVGNIFQKKRNEKRAKIGLYISIISSLLGILLMVTW